MAIFSSKNRWVLVKQMFADSFLYPVFSRHTWNICRLCMHIVGNSMSPLDVRLACKYDIFRTWSNTDCCAPFSTLTLYFRWWVDHLIRLYCVRPFSKHPALLLFQAFFHIYHRPLLANWCLLLFFNDNSNVRLSTETIKREINESFRSNLYVRDICM